MSRMLPVDMFMFPEGLYVIGAAPGGERLLGAKVEKIGGLTIDEAMAALDPVLPRDNDHWLTLTFPVFVRYTTILEGLGIDHGLTVRLADGTPDEVRLEAAPIDFHWDRYPAGWTALADTATGPPPLHLRHRELPFWFEYLPSEDLVYFQFTPSATTRRRHSRRSATGCSASSRTGTPAGSSSICGGTAAVTRCSASICCIT